MIVVFDSGVWVSALHFGGTPLDALDSVTGRSLIAVCDPILEEIHSVLRLKFKWRQERIDQALAEYASETFVVQTRGNLRGICRDPKDDMVFECAVLAGASIIVSGDKDLLALKTYEGIHVLTPREFLQLLESRVP